MDVLWVGALDYGLCVCLYAVCASEPQFVSIVD